MPARESGFASTQNEFDGLPEISPDYAYFLDIDGTLLDIAERPQLILNDPDLRRLLRGILEVTGGALALISGRSIVDIDRLLAAANFCVAGQHGAERRDAAGRTHLHRMSLGKLRQAEIRLRQLVAEHPELVLEDKGMSIALHYRRAPQFAEQAYEIMRDLIGKIGRGFELQAGKMVFEIKSLGTSKGAAIEEYLREKPFLRRLPVFIGDDLTDETGFEMINHMGGHSIKVGEGVSSARFRLADATAVRAWLGAFVERHRSGERSSL